MGICKFPEWNEGDELLGVVLHQVLLLGQINPLEIATPLVFFFVNLWLVYVVMRLKKKEQIVLPEETFD